VSPHGSTGDGSRKDGARGLEQRLHIACVKCASENGASHVDPPHDLEPDPDGGGPRIRDGVAPDRLTGASCSSIRGFAPRFLHAVLAVRRSAVHFDRYDQLSRGLASPSQRPCWAHRGRVCGQTLRQETSEHESIQVTHALRWVGPRSQRSGPWKSSVCPTTHGHAHDRSRPRAPPRGLLRHPREPFPLRGP
jgi:hypothetical protein